jgi:hypothetical protein
MASHIKVLGILHIALASMGILGAVVVLLIFGGLAGIVGVSDHSGNGAVGAAAIPIISGIAGLICVLLLAVSLPGFIGGIGLLMLAPWSRILMLIVSVLDLIHVPFGTALGIYGLWVLTKPESEALLSGRRSQATAY